MSSDDKTKLIEQLMASLTLAAEAPFKGMDVAEKPQPLKLSPHTGRAVARHIMEWVGDLPADKEFPHPQARSIESACEPTNQLPATRETLPSVEKLAGLTWNKIGHLPGYSMSGIRAMGRDVFRSLECFHAFEAQLRHQGKDPLAETLVISEWTHDKTTVNTLAKMISENGQKLAAGIMEHPQIPNYEPEVIIFMTKDWTFKLVRDRKDNGAPVELNSIYAWPGGTFFYEKKLQPSPRVGALEK